MASPQSLTDRLEYLAHTIELRFGKHPEADLVREAKNHIIALETPETPETQAPSKGEAPTKRATKKEANNV